MNEKIKKVLCVIGSFFVGIISGLCTVLLHHRRTTDGVTNNNIDPEGTIRDNEEQLDYIESSNSNAKEQLEHIEQSTRRAETILQTIREKQQIKDN